MTDDLDLNDGSSGLYVEPTVDAEKMKKLAVQASVIAKDKPTSSFSIALPDVDALSTAVEKAAKAPILLASSYFDAEERALDKESSSYRIISYFLWDDPILTLPMALDIVDEHFKSIKPLIALVLPHLSAAVARVLTVLYGTVLVADKGQERPEQFFSFSKFDDFQRSEKAREVFERNNVNQNQFHVQEPSEAEGDKTHEKKQRPSQHSGAKSTAAGHENGKSKLNRFSNVNGGSKRSAAGSSVKANKRANVGDSPELDDEAYNIRKGKGQLVLAKSAGRPNSVVDDAPDDDYEPGDFD